MCFCFDTRVICINCRAHGSLCKSDGDELIGPESRSDGQWTYFFLPSETLTLTLTLALVHSVLISKKKIVHSVLSSLPIELMKQAQELLRRFFLLFLLSLAAPRGEAAGGRGGGFLSPNYYHRSCPGVEKIVSDTVTSKQIANPTTAAGTLRLFFHDCFVTGCDASVLISKSSMLPSSLPERDSEINLSLPGDAFDAVVRAKAALELQCPGQV